MAADVEQLVISLGLDPSAFRAALSVIRGGLDQVEGGLQALGSNMQQAGRAMQDAGAKGKAGMAGLQNEVRRVGAEANKTAASFQKLGDSMLGKLRGIIGTYVAPIAGLGALGGIIGGYASDLAKVAEQTGRYSKQLEEQRKKKELLNRVTKEDLDLYIKGREAMSKLEYATRSAGNALMRSFGGALTWVIEKLSAAADWIRSNEGNITRFVKIVAALILGSLVPALVKLALSGAVNPVTLLIAGLAALAVVIDDLVVYMQGGESAFGELWSQFGTGEEISAALGKAWETLKEIGIAVFEGLKSAVGKLWDYFGPVVKSMGSLAADWVKAIAALLTGDWAGAWEGAKNCISGLLQVFSNIWNGISQMLGDLVGLLGEAWDAASAKMSEWKEAAAGIVQGWISEAGQSVSAFVSSLGTAIAAMWDDAAKSVKGAWEGVVGWFREQLSWIFNMAGKVASIAGSVWGAVKGIFGGGSSAAPTANNGADGGGAIPTSAQLGAAAVPASVNSNTTNTTTNTATVGKIDIVVPNGDPNAIAAGVGGALNSELQKFGTAAADTGTRQ